MKNKDCCQKDKISDKKIGNLINEAIELASTPSEEELVKGINLLESYATYNHTNIHFIYSILANLSMAYHNRGDDEKAIALIAKSQKEYVNFRTDVFLNLVKAISLCAVGYTAKASSLAKSVMSNPDFSDERFGLFFIEIGKIFTFNGDVDDAIDCFNKAVSFSRKEKDKWHEERALANLSLVKMLHSDNPDIREKGAEEIMENCNGKIAIGDLEGLSTNYCNLAIYYLNKKDFKGVLSYARRDLYISQITGNLRSTFVSLLNLASYYVVLKQFKKVRHILKECNKIATELNDTSLISEVKQKESSLTEIIKESISQKESFDDKALCMCDSGKLFKDCCIVGDVEPVEEMPFKLDFKIHEEEREITKRYNNPNSLDFIFRKTYDTETQLRLTWNQVKCHTGCYEITALPDMCSLYIQSIDEQLKIIDNTEKSTINNVLSCLILSVCAIESYINQVAYFFDSIKSQTESHIFTYPTEITTKPDIYTFQQTTELSYKWEILGKALCGTHWKPSQKDWDNFILLIKIRNEFVHFKLLEYEAIYPSVIKKEHDLIKRLPKEVILNDIKMPWNFRILSPSFAHWTKKTAVGMIDYFKHQYDERRKED